MNHHFNPEGFKIKKVERKNTFFLKAYLFQLSQADFGFSASFGETLNSYGKRIDELTIEDIEFLCLIPDSNIEIDNRYLYYFQDGNTDYSVINNNIIHGGQPFELFPKLFTNINQISFDQGGLAVLERFDSQIYELYTADGLFLQGPCHDLDLLDNGKYLYRNSDNTGGFKISQYKLNSGIHNLAEYRDDNCPYFPTIFGRDRIFIPLENETPKRIENFETPLNKTDASIILDNPNTNWHTSPELAIHYMDNAELAIKAMYKDPLAYTLLNDQIKEDRDVVLTLAGIDGAYLEFVASEKLKDDSEIILSAIKSSEHALRFASDSLKKEIELINSGNSDHKAIISEEDLPF